LQQRVQDDLEYSAEDGLNTKKERSWLNHTDYGCRIYSRWDKYSIVYTPYCTLCYL